MRHSCLFLVLRNETPLFYFPSGSTFEGGDTEGRGDVLQSFTGGGDQSQRAAQRHAQATAAALVAPKVAGRR